MLAPSAARAADHHMPDDVKQSIGCVIAGTAGVAGAVAAGGENLINLIAGGLVAPQNRAVLYIGLAGVVFASFCAMGQALTPVYLYYTEPPAPPETTQGDAQAALRRRTGTVAPACPDAGCAPPLRAAFRSGVLARSADAAALRVERLPGPTGLPIGLAASATSPVLTAARPPATRSEER
jgi:hypothetical protein